MPVKNWPIIWLEKTGLLHGLKKEPVICLEKLAHYMAWENWPVRWLTKRAHYIPWKNWPIRWLEKMDLLYSLKKNRPIRCPVFLKAWNGPIFSSHLKKYSGEQNLWIPAKMLPFFPHGSCVIQIFPNTFEGSGNTFSFIFQTLMN